MFPCCHVQSAVHLLALSLNLRWYQQMSGAGDHPLEREELECRRVRVGESGRETNVGSTATGRADSSIWSVRILMSSPDEDKRETQRGGVPPAI